MPMKGDMGQGITQSSGSHVESTGLAQREETEGAYPPPLTFACPKPGKTLAMHVGSQAPRKMHRGVHEHPKTPKHKH